MTSGIIYHIVAKIAFIVGSYVIHFYLGRTMSPSEYGIVGTIITIINLEYLLINNGVRQAISSTISLSKYSVNDIRIKGLVIQSIIILFISSLVILSSKPLAIFLGEENLSGYILLTIPVVISMGLYFALIGVINGHKDFRRESFVLTIYPILKLSVIPFSSYFFKDRLFGVECGFIFSGISILIICFFAQNKYSNSSLSDKAPLLWLIKKSLSFSIVFIAASLIMNIDLLFVKSLVKDPAYSGYYTGAMNFAKIPYFILTAVFLVTLPIMTELYANNKISELKSKVSNLLAVIFVVVAPISTIISATSPTLMKSFYSDKYESGSLSLSLLVYSTFFLGLTIVICMILSAIRHEKLTLIVSTVMLGIIFVLCPIFTIRFSIFGAALSSFCSNLLSLILSLLFLRKIIGNTFNKSHLIAILSNILLFAVAYLFNRFTNITSLLWVAFLYAFLYFGFLIFSIMVKTINYHSIIGAIKNEKNNKE